MFGSKPYRGFSIWATDDHDIPVTPHLPRVPRFAPMTEPNLAYALFECSDDVEAFVMLRAENQGNYLATLQRVWERDENGWRTQSEIRAARLIASMRRKAAR